MFLTHQAQPSLGPSDAKPGKKFAAAPLLAGEASSLPLPHYDERGAVGSLLQKIPISGSPEAFRKFADISVDAIVRPVARRPAADAATIMNGRRRPDLIPLSRFSSSKLGRRAAVELRGERNRAAGRQEQNGSFAQQLCDDKNQDRSAEAPAKEDIEQGKADGSEGRE
jgi:hypothetical protein